MIFPIRMCWQGRAGWQGTEGRESGQQVAGREASKEGVDPKGKKRKQNREGTLGQHCFLAHCRTGPSFHSYLFNTGCFCTFVGRLCRQEPLRELPKDSDQGK